MKHILIIMFLLSVSQQAYGQDNQSRKKFYLMADIHRANKPSTVLDAGNADIIRLMSTPRGSGSAVNSENLFPSGDSNLVFVSFKISQDAEYMTFKIIPDSTNDDYDFLIFKGEEGKTLQDILGQGKKPLRSNSARTQNRDGGVTGLMYDTSLPEHIGAGNKSSFSKGIPHVKRGEVYYLVINNVYDDGGGATISINYWKSKTLTGTVTDDQNRPIKAEVTWEDRSTGTVIVSTNSDVQTGEFSIDVPFTMGATYGYSLVLSTDSHVFLDTVFTYGQILTCSPEPLHVVLKDLKKGERLKPKSIHFVADKAEFLSGAEKDLRRMYKLMKANPHLKVVIEGHTNGMTSTTQQLSDDRAQAVKDYLVRKGISGNRMKTVGLDGTQMLYPYPRTEVERSQNRRVEFLVE